MERVINSVFDYCGYKCTIVEIIDNNDLGFFQFNYPNKYYCGYVLLPRYHKCFEKDYCDIKIKCHGGLTFSSHDLLGTRYSGWWIGFDCAHPDDVRNPKDTQFVKQECMNIVDQLRDME